MRASGDAAILLANTYADIQFSERYGGNLPEGAPASPVDELLNRVGAVVTISGRTIREEARVDPYRAQAALDAVVKVLAQVPEGARGDTAVRAQEAPARG